MKMKVISLFSCSLLLILTACERNENLPSYYAEGAIITVTDHCFGEMVLIEVEHPNGIGMSGTIPYYSSEENSYNNGIGIPYFSKIGLPDSIPQIVGTKLHFEYREITDKEWEKGNLFSSDEPVPCPAIIGPLVAKLFIITRVISYDCSR